MEGTKEYRHPKCMSLPANLAIIAVKEVTSVLWERADRLGYADCCIHTAVTNIHVCSSVCRYS